MCVLCCSGGLLLCVLPVESVHGSLLLLTKGCDGELVSLIVCIHTCALSTLFELALKGQKLRCQLHICLERHAAVQAVWSAARIIGFAGVEWLQQTIESPASAQAGHSQVELSAIHLSSVAACGPTREVVGLQFLTQL